MAAAILRQRGEWNAQTGADLEVVETTGQKLAQADALPADAVLCPSHLLGVLAERTLLAPVPPRILKSDSWGEVFELLRLREAAWAKQPMAVPFGSPRVGVLLSSRFVGKTTAPSAANLGGIPGTGKIAGRKRGRWQREGSLGRHHRTADIWLGGAHAACPCGLLRQTSRQLLDVVQHRYDGTDGGWPAVRPGVGRPRGGSKNSDQPTHLASIRRRPERHSCAANAAWR